MLKRISPLQLSGPGVGPCFYVRQRCRRKQISQLRLISAASRSPGFGMLARREEELFRTGKRDFSMYWILGVFTVTVGYGYFHWRPKAMAQAPPPAATTSTLSTAPLESVAPPFYDVSEANIDAAKAEFVEFLGEGGVSDDLGARIAHSSTEWSPAPRGDLDRPHLLVYPRSTDDVSRIAKICHRRRIPMIAFSGGTSLEGTLAAVEGGVCIDFSRMNKVIALHKRDMDVVVQPGVGYVELNQLLAKEGLFFPPDPGPGAQIGGMISQGCSGPNAYRWGTMKDWVLGLTVVLADGTVIKTRHRPRKSSAGFNLTQLMVSQEGLLGFVTEASLKITNKPENLRVATATFPTTQDAVDVVVKVVQQGLPLTAVELLDEISMRSVNESGYCDRSYEERPTLFLRFSGTVQNVAEQIEQVQAFAQASKCSSFDIAQNEEEGDSLWQARKTILWSQMALKNDPSDMFLSADLAVPISRLAEIIDTSNQRLQASGLVGGCLGHVGDGNFHLSIFYNKSQETKARQLVADMQRLTIQMEGTITGEHGIGLEHRDMLVEELGQESIDTMRKIKLALDPLCLLNPGKVLRIKPADGP